LQEAPNAMTHSKKQPSSSNSDRSLLRTAAPVAAAFVALLAVTPVHAADAPDAAKLWSKHCQTCHGPDGKGKTKAGEKAHVKDLTAADVKAGLTKQKAIDSMKKGIKEKDSDKMAMKSYADKLSDAEIEALADYSLTFK
jgi:cytochrome c553